MSVRAPLNESRHAPGANSRGVRRGKRGAFRSIAAQAANRLPDVSRDSF